MKRNVPNVGLRKMLTNLHLLIMEQKKEPTMDKDFTRPNIQERVNGNVPLSHDMLLSAPDIHSPDALTPAKYEQRVNPVGKSTKDRGSSPDSFGTANSNILARIKELKRLKEDTSIPIEIRVIYIRELSDLSEMLDAVEQEIDQNKNRYHLECRVCNDRGMICHKHQEFDEILSNLKQKLATWRENL